MPRIKKITKEEYERAAQMLSWFTLPQLVLLITGKTDRHYRTERVIKKLNLKVEQYGHLKAYLVPRLSKKPDYNEPGHIAHGIAVSQIIISLLLSDPKAQVIPKKVWYGKGIYPDASILFSNGWFLPVEFATKEHSRLIRVYKSKVSRYLSILEEKWQVLFVMDITKERLEYLVSQYTNHEAFYYTTYAGFTQIPYGQHLTTPCYLNGATLKWEALR